MTLGWVSKRPLYYILKKVKKTLMELVFYFCYQINGPIEYIELNAASNRKSCSQRL